MQPYLRSLLNSLFTGYCYPGQTGNFDILQYDKQCVNFSFFRDRSVHVPLQSCRLNVANIKQLTKVVNISSYQNSQQIQLTTKWMKQNVVNNMSSMKAEEENCLQCRKNKNYWYSVLNRTRKYRTERGAIYSGIALAGQGLSEKFCVFAEQFGVTTSDRKYLQEIALGICPFGTMSGFRKPCFPDLLIMPVKFEMSYNARFFVALSISC